MEHRIIIKTPFELTKQQQDKLKQLALAKSGLKDAHITIETDPTVGLTIKILHVFDSIKEFDLSLEEAVRKIVLEDTTNLHEYLKQQKFKNIGFITYTDGPVAYAIGLADIAYGELLEIEGTNIKAMAIDLLEDKTGIIILGDYTTIKAGTKVIATGKQLHVTVSNAIMGRHVDALGTPRDNMPLKHTKDAKDMPVERIAPGVIEREPVKEPVQTGILAIDAMIPIGRGQRELIIGDRKTGKTTIAIDTILNQKGKNLICIYTAIGQRSRTVASLLKLLKENDALDYTIVVSATATDPAPMQYIAPYTATAIAEYFLEQGKDVLVIYDDLSKHAWAYRQISLLLKRPPGREAYPGDIFYLHSKLLERACKLNPEHGGGSITALPIIQTEASDVSAYIPTNVISITDGQIYLEPDLFNAGVRPAINVGLSVSRVGSSAQTPIMKKIAKQLRLDLAQYRELAAFAQFGGELDKSTQQRLDHGKRLVELLKQPANQPYSLAEEVVLLYAGVNGYLNQLEVSQIQEWKESALTLLNTQFSNLAAEIEEQKTLTDQIETQIKELIELSLKSFVQPSEQ